MDKKTILIVDDEQDTLSVLEKALTTEGYSVITATSAKSLSAAKINGYKVCGLLKKDTRYAKIPVVMFTAKAQEKDIKLGQEVGADAYITKPYESEVLLAKIKELLKE